MEFFYNIIDWVQDYFPYGSQEYLIIKTLHVISVITWMAGLFYLPRLFVYHAAEPVGSETSERFKVMERRLLKAIMNPSLVIVLATGPLLMMDFLQSSWLWVKITMVCGMVIVHFFCIKWVRAFAENRNVHPHVFYRYMNEVPTLLMLVIVPMVILKPF